MHLKKLHPNLVFWLKNAVFLLAVLPLTKLLYRVFNNSLGANPVEKITHVTGYWTLVFLLLTLTITPLRHLSGWAWLMRLRRMLGLFAFFYSCLHLLTYLILDQFFDWSAILEDILKRPYITVGFACFVLLIPLAVTSTKRMIKRLGGKRWQLLHRLIYPIAIGGVVHFWWSVKKDISEPLLFAVLLAVLLAIRLFYRVRKTRREKS